MYALDGISLASNTVDTLSHSTMVRWPEPRTRESIMHLFSKSLKSSGIEDKSTKPVSDEHGGSRRVVGVIVLCVLLLVVL